MTDTYTPTGSDGIALHKLRRMVSKSASFQSRSELTEAELFARGRYTINDDFADAPRPFYVIIAANSVDRLIAGGAQNFLVPAGTVGLFLEVDALESLATDNDQRLEAVDFFGLVRADIRALAAADDSGQASSHLDITGITTFAYHEAKLETQPSTGRYFSTLYVLEWGPQA